jgi:hypothetical protein
MSSKKKQIKAKEALIYCGPNLPRGILNHATVYQGEPAHLYKNFEACPEIRRLLVPVDQFTATMAAINKSGSAESVWLKKVQEYIQGGVKQ